MSFLQVPTLRQFVLICAFLFSAVQAGAAHSGDQAGHCAGEGRPGTVGEAGDSRGGQPSEQGSRSLTRPAPQNLATETLGK